MVHRDPKFEQFDDGFFWGQDSIGYKACYKGCEYGDPDKHKVCIVKFVFLGGGA